MSSAKKSRRPVSKSKSAPAKAAKKPAAPAKATKTTRPAAAAKPKLAPKAKTPVKSAPAPKAKPAPAVKVKPAIAAKPPVKPLASAPAKVVTKGPAKAVTPPKPAVKPTAAPPITSAKAVAPKTAKAPSPPSAGTPVATPKPKPPSMVEVKKRRRGKATPVGIAPSEPERDILDQYLYEVSTYPLLKAHEEIELAKKIRAGDQDCLQELVKRNLRFVISVAKKYQNRGLPLIDLIGEGNVGLLTAARKFDPDQGVKFISYAVWWIRQAILSSLARQGRTVRVPLNRTADLSRIIKASEILRQKLRREPSPEELAQVTGLSVDVVQSLAALNTGDVRLDAPMDPEGDRSLIERFVADEMPDTEEEAMNRFLTDEIETALNTLPPRDAKVLRLYFGLEGGREHTLEEIGSMLGVTRERVRQLRDRALKRLREGDVGRALGSFAA
jgi:RNA polymerase primary sigma factor